MGFRSHEPSQFDPALKATTDQDGKYRITDVPQGKYLIAPVAPALVIADAHNSFGQNLIITGGDNIEGVDFDLIRGGVITGKVTDAEDHPIVGQEVNLLSADDSRGGSYYGLPSSFQTDDRGIYRIFGIRPGRYKVSVGAEPVYRGVGRGRDALPITFYPDTNEAAKAGVIEIGEGTEATKIDITLNLRPIEGFAVSGRIIDGETGKPVSNVAISLSRIIIDGNSTSRYSGGTDVRSNVDGAFRLEKLPAGKYSISIEAGSESDLRAGQVMVDVVDQDVTGVLIKAIAGASLSGSVVLEGSRAAQRPSWISAVLRAEGFGASKSAEIKPDGSFRIGGLPAGNVIFSVGSWTQIGNAQPITISRVERDGVIQPNGVQVQTGEHVTGIRIVAAHGSGSIRGVVKVENGTLPQGAHLVVSLSKLGDTSTPPGGGTEADARGRFLIEGLASGTYELTVSAYVRNQRPRSTKQLVTVTDGATTDVMVTLDLTATPSL